ncbi:hypothetical protein BDD43_4924 [Mucilaginibacter gracilis]|uniref:Uncharacterized protein n=1 Tax=Mucilaginibacter gracilis TaxID=423350 RepID=A0A495J8F8_9SPHI|nr:hypothetical protein [Mucilaginibacter gracilis]RKR84674.1 hypothetical protein BDD43_4924 [Mucilaginibacter gracilis]
MKSTIGRNCLILLLGFLSLGAIGGGASLIISPNGSLIGMPLFLLKKSPFHDFLIPGIVLFLLLGVAPFVLVFALIRKPASEFAEKLNCYDDMYWAWTFSIYTAFMLIAWIQLEMMFLQAVSWLHTFYMSLAIAILFVALLPAVRSLYQKSS